MTTPAPGPEFDALLAGLAEVERVEREADEALRDGLAQVSRALDEIVEALRAA